MLPPLHARYSLSHGELPIYTELWYGGRYQFMNPLWKGFYPPVWPLYIPHIPLVPALKVIIVAHFVATASLSYYYANKELSWYLSIPFALVWVMPFAGFGPHLQKTFAWPWFCLVAWQTARVAFDRPRRRSGLLAGIGLGMMLNAGGAYYFFYGCCLLVPFVLAFRLRSFTRGAATGALVGLPHLLFSVVPVMLAGVDRPRIGYGLELRELIAGVTGVWINAVGPGPRIIVSGAVPFEGYAVVGLTTCVLALTAVSYAYLRPTPVRSRWLVAVLGAGMLGVLLATAWPLLYELPGVSSFRTAGRANVIVALVSLIGAYYAIVRLQRSDRRVLHIVGSIAVVCAVVNGAATWAIVDTGSAVQPAASETIADAVSEEGCESAWIEMGSSLSSDTAVQAGYALTKRGVPLTAVYYGRIGQRYSTHRDGTLTFDVLITGSKLPEHGSVTLSGGWSGKNRGHIDASRFGLVRSFETTDGPVYLYAPGGSCQ